MQLALVRGALVVAAIALALFTSSENGSPWLVALAAAILAGCAILLEHVLGRVAPLRVTRAALGALCGAAGALALLAALAFMGARPSWVVAPVFLGLSWIGGVIGARTLSTVEAARSKTAGTPHESPHKVLDTSVIIDGRIADIIEAGFIEGILVIPQFVLRELQQVADSSDPLKRNRGRKGLDILRFVQESDRVNVELTDRDYPDVRDVDAKLLCLAEELGGKVLTNDYNLNKVAQLRGVPVLNVNDLANAMKPVVLPGELLVVQIIKEGKERNQGVGYLDDGTMVVVESGRKYIGQKVEVVVSSVIQTNAGKMIFGLIDAEEPESVPRPRIMRRAAEPAQEVDRP